MAQPEAGKFQLQRRGERRATISEELCGVYDANVL